MNSNIVIDIVLIPPDDVIEKCIDLNQQIKSNYIKLSKEKQIPHISLLMGGCSQQNLTEVNKLLLEIVKRFKPFELEIVKARSGKVSSNLVIKRNSKIFDLHKQIVDNIASLLTYNNKIESVYDSINSLPFTLDWINGFLNNSTLGNFDPHITLGDAPLDGSIIKLPISFVVNRLAVCHLGNMCTCRKTLFEYKLK